jgi:acetyltransferase-like isoleucine patch superfamily enzyme
MINPYKLHAKLWHLYFVLKAKFFYRFFFKKIGNRSAIYTPSMLGFPGYIEIGSKVTVRYGCRLEVIDPKVSGVGAPLLKIGSNVNIEQNVHIVCGNQIVIGDNVSITGGVAIVDVEHPYEDVDSKVKIGRRIKCVHNFVRIKDGAFIGYGAIILPNVTIGQNAVVGAHSVVNIDVPDYSVVAGNPARLIRRFDLQSKTWVKEK